MNDQQNNNFSTTPDYAHPWLADQGNGTYRNPILYADYSDPDVIRVGDNYYLVASSFNCTPGLPILYSQDLVNWSLIGHALENLPHPRYEKVQPGCGVWAPALRFHAGKYWIFYPTPDEGIFLVTADHPAGPWSAPHLVQAGKGLIDPCPLWDEDGQAYLVHAYAGSRAGIKHRLRICPLAPDGTKLLGEGEIIFHQPEKHPTLEGPKFLKRNGWYYVLAPAGGVETGWQVVLRSRNIYGPYEDKIVLSQGDSATNGPHQGALVDTPAGDWWFLHFQDAGVYGRILHLQPVQWQDDWPLMGRQGTPVQGHAKPVQLPMLIPCAPLTSDEFELPVLGCQWQWQANHRGDWYSLAARPGWLRLFPQPATTPLLEQANLLLQKFPARSFTVETALECSARQPGEAAGLVVAGETQIRLGIECDGTTNRIVLRSDEQTEILAEASDSTLQIRVHVAAGGRCSFAFAQSGQWVAVARTLQATKGKWIGAKVGLYSVKPAPELPAGYVDFDYFRFY